MKLDVRQRKRGTPTRSSGQRNATGWSSGFSRSQRELGKCDCAKSLLVYSAETACYHATIMQQGHFIIKTASPDARDRNCIKESVAETNDVVGICYFLSSRFTQLWSIQPPPQGRVGIEQEFQFSPSQASISSTGRGSKNASVSLISPLNLPG